MRKCTWPRQGSNRKLPKLYIRYQRFQYWPFHPNRHVYIYIYMMFQLEALTIPFLNTLKMPLTCQKNRTQYWPRFWPNDISIFDNAIKFLHRIILAIHAIFWLAKTKDIWLLKYVNFVTKTLLKFTYIVNKRRNSVETTLLIQSNLLFSELTFKPILYSLNWFFLKLII